jgi:predicted dehydrogenase
MSKPRVAVVGAGHWSALMHRPALKRLTAEGRLEVAAVCDLDAGKARAYADELGVERTFTDLEGTVAAVDPDGLILLVPTRISASLIRQAVKLGKPFLVEKPPAPTSDEHRRLIDEVGDLTHVVAYNRRHSPYVFKARELLAGHQAQVVACHFARSRRRKEDFSTTAVHGIDTVRCLGGDWAGMRLEVARSGEVLNFFIDGWTRSGARLDMHITPDTGSGEEHYFVRCRDVSVFVVFPHWSLADRPGYVEARRNRTERRRFGPDELGLDAEDNPLLAGVCGEHLAFARALGGEAPAESTLAATLQTQLIREELKKAIDSGAKSSVTEVSF